MSETIKKRKKSFQKCSFLKCVNHSPGKDVKMHYFPNNVDL